MRIIENYAKDNEFDVCFLAKPKSELTETVVEESGPGCSYYSPPSSSSPPLCPSSDVIQSYDYASEPENEDESSVADREVEEKRFKRDESILNLDELVRQSPKRLKSSKITVDDSISAPLDWSLRLLNKIHCRVKKKKKKKHRRGFKSS